MIGAVPSIAPVKGATFDTSTDSLEAVRNRLDALLAEVEGATFSTGTDSLEAIRDKIDTLTGGLSAKEKSLLGVGTSPGWQEFFLNVADGADPAAADWTVVETGAGTAVVENDLAHVPGHLFCNAGITMTDDAIAYTKDKHIFSLKNSTSLHISGRIRFNAVAQSATHCAIGFIANSITPTSCIDIEAVAAFPALFRVRNNPRQFESVSGDGAVLEVNNLSAFITDNTWYDFKISISAANVLFYVDGTLRATHAARVPSNLWQVVVAATSPGGQADTSVQFLQVWTE